MKKFIKTFGIFELISNILLIVGSAYLAFIYCFINFNELCAFLNTAICGIWIIIFLYRFEVTKEKIDSEKSEENS